MGHEGKKELTVEEPVGQREEDWDEFFAKMFGLIRGSTKGGISDILAADFTTTGKVEAILSHAVVMDSFQEYFKYGRAIPMCGIRQLHLSGSLNDWRKLASKADAL